MSPISLLPRSLLLRSTISSASSLFSASRSLSITSSKRTSTPPSSSSPSPAKPVYTPLATAKAQADGAAKVDGVVLSETNKAEKTYGRFWKAVNIKHTPEGIQILLDARPLRTPGGKPLLIPSNRAPVAFLIANEWENQKQILKNHALPMTSLATRALDSLAPTATSSEGLGQSKTHSEVCAALLRYLGTDTICFQEVRQHGDLVKLQEERWDPVLDWVREEYGLEVKVHDSLFSSRQPPATTAKLAEIISNYSSWKLAAFERAVYTTKSFLLALALVEGRLTVEEASLASHVEVDSQIRLWGEVEDTHDVDFQDVRRQLGSVKCFLIDSDATESNAA
ncbi:hypothetical protein BDY24DRAFT_28855 [Mrakia frigida]|uniref:ATP synthase complex assembly protein ATP12 n=1 Tax=Mrakia frigida TaxID=29902 RepID=UPI003FCBF0FF